MQIKILIAATNADQHTRYYDIQKLTDIQGIHQEIYNRTYEF